MKQLFLQGFLGYYHFLLGAVVGVIPGDNVRIGEENVANGLEDKEITL